MSRQEKEPEDAKVIPLPKKPAPTNPEPKCTCRPGSINSCPACSS